jgi:hypothetical protein
MQALPDLSTTARVMLIRTRGGPFSRQGLKWVPARARPFIDGQFCCRCEASSSSRA